RHGRDKARGHLAGPVGAVGKRAPGEEGLGPALRRACLQAYQAAGGRGPRGRARYQAMNSGSCMTATCPARPAWRTPASICRWQPGFDVTMTSGGPPPRAAIAAIFRSKTAADT